MKQSLGVVAEEYQDKLPSDANNETKEICQRADPMPLQRHSPLKGASATTDPGPTVPTASQ